MLAWDQILADQNWEPKNECSQSELHPRNLSEWGQLDSMTQ